MQYLLTYHIILYYVCNTIISRYNILYYIGTISQVICGVSKVSTHKFSILYQVRPDRRD